MHKIFRYLTCFCSSSLSIFLPISIFISLSISIFFQTACSIDDSDRKNSEVLQKNNHRSISIIDHSISPSTNHQHLQNLVSNITNTPISNTLNSSLVVFNHNSSPPVNLQSSSKPTIHSIDSITVIDDDDSSFSYISNNDKQFIHDDDNGDDYLTQNNCFDHNLATFSNPTKHHIDDLKHCEAFIVNSPDLSSSYLFIPSADLTDLSLYQDYSSDKYQHILASSENPEQLFKNTYQASATTLFPPILASLGLASSVKLTSNPLLSGIIIIASVGIISGYLHSLKTNITDFASLQSASNQPNHHNPALNRPTLSSPQKTGKNNTNNNNNSDPNMVPAAADIDQDTQHKPSSNPLVRRVKTPPLPLHPSIHSSKDHFLNPSNFLPNHQDDNFFYSLEEYLPRITRINNFHFRTIYPQDLNLTESQKKLLTDLVHNFFLNTTRTEADRIILDIYHDLVNSSPYVRSFFNNSYSTRFVKKKVLITWIYHNLGPLNSALALKILTNDPVSTKELARLFNISENQIKNHILPIKIELLKIYHRSFLYNIKDLDVLADYLTMSFSLFPQYPMIDMINASFHVNYYLPDFYKAVFTFVKMYNLSSIYRIVFLTKILKMYPQDLLLDQIILDYLKTNHIDPVKFQAEITTMKKVFNQFLITKRYELPHNQSLDMFQDIIDNLSDFEAGIYSKITASYSYNNGNILSYRKNNYIASRLNSTVDSYYKEYRALDLSKTFLRKLLFVEVFSKSKNNSYFMNFADLNFEQFSKLKDSLHLNYQKLGYTYYNLKPVHIEDFLTFSDDQITALANHLFKFSDKNLLTNPQLVKMLILQFYNHGLNRDLEKEIFLNYVLRLRLTDINTLNFTARRFYSGYPEIHIDNPFAMGTYLQESPTKIVELIDQISHKFLEFIGDLTKSIN